MKQSDKQSFGVKLLLTLGKIVLFILVFPYQIVINRKEGHYSVRSLLSYIRIEKNEDGKKNSFRYTLSFPGLCLKELKKPKSCAKTAKAPAAAEESDDAA